MILLRGLIRALSLAMCASPLEFKCQPRGMETCLHSRGAALNVRETGIYFNRQMLAKNKAKISKFIAVLPKSGFNAAPEDCLRRPQVFICRMR